MPSRERPGQPVDFPRLYGGPGINEKALALITPLVGDAIEALPLRCVNRPKEKYYVINVLDLVDCLDEDRSEIRRYHNGALAQVYKYVFKPGTTEGHHIFKLAQDPLGDVLVSGEFKRLVEDSGLTGAFFKPVGEAVERERLARVN